jgi:hypothetical protein
MKNYDRFVKVMFSLYIPEQIAKMLLQALVKCQLFHVSIQIIFCFKWILAKVKLQVLNKKQVAEQRECLECLLRHSIGFATGSSSRDQYVSPRDLCCRYSWHMNIIPLIIWYGCECFVLIINVAYIFHCHGNCCHCASAVAL